MRATFWGAKRLKFNFYQDCAGIFFTIKEHCVHRDSRKQRIRLGYGEGFL